MEHSLKEIIIKAKNGDNDAIAYLYETYYKDVYYTCFKLLQNENVAADMTQETFIKAFEQLGKLVEEEKFKSWICQIANHMSLNYIKRSKIIEFGNIDSDDTALNIPDETSKTPEEIMVDKDVAQILLQAVEKLPYDQRLCVFMYYYQNMSVKEIAEQMGCSENTIRGKLRYANSNLRKYIENLNEDGIKLRCIAVLPFLYLVFRTEFEEKMIEIPKQGINKLTGRLTGLKNASKAGKAVAAAKTGLSVGGIVGITVGSVAVLVFMIVGIVVGVNSGLSKKNDSSVNHDMVNNETTEKITESMGSAEDEENIGNDESDDITKHFSFNSTGIMRMAGRYFYYADADTGMYVIKDLLTGEVIKEFSQGDIKFKECEEALIVLCEREEYMDVVVLDKDGNYIMTDTAYIAGTGQEFDYAYFIRDYAIDDLMLSKEGDFVYLSCEDDKYVIKSFDLAGGNTKYKIDVPRGVICAKNEHYFVYNDMENSLIEIRDIYNGNIIASYNRDEYKLDYVRLLDEYYAVCTTNNGYITNYGSFDKNGDEIVNRDFDIGEKVAFIDNPGIEYAMGLNILPMQKENDGVKEKGLFRADLTPIVDFSEENTEYELFTYSEYLGRHSKLYAWIDYDYTGAVFLNNGETIIEAHRFLDTSNDVFIAMNNEETKTVINMENGCVFEISLEADLIKINENSRNYMFLVKEEDRCLLYDKMGKLVLNLDVPVYESIYGRTTISYTYQGNIFVYNNVNEETNILYCYDASTGDTQELATDYEVYSCVIKDEGTIIYVSKAGDTYKYILKEIKTGEEKLLFESQYGDIYLMSGYGFVIGKTESEKELIVYQND